MISASFSTILTPVSIGQNPQNLEEEKCPQTPFRPPQGKVAQIGPPIDQRAKKYPIEDLFDSK